MAWSKQPTGTFSSGNLFQGIFADGLIVSEKIFGEKDGLHIPNIVLAMYGHHYAIDNLKQIVVYSILNDDTVMICREELYSEMNELDSTSGRDRVQHWPHSTPE